MKTATLALATVALTACLSIWGTPALSASPEAPKVSSFAPAADLAAQLKAYVDEIKETVATEQEYKDADGKVGKVGNTLMLIAIALGLHDTDNPYKAAAPAIFKAAKDLAATTTYAAAKDGVNTLVAATEAKTTSGEVKWEKPLSLDELMKQVPAVNTKMKLKLKSFPKSASAVSAVAEHSAVLAVIAQGSIYDTHEAKNDAQIQQWYKFCETMRDSAAELNKAAHAKNKTAADAANKKLAQSCDDCHAIFHPGK